MLEAVLWDNDGVLVDTEPLYFRATRELLAQAGVELSAAEFIRRSLRDGHSAFDLLRDRGVSVEEIEALRVARNARYSDLLRADVPVRDGVRESLAALYGRVPMGIVTSSLREHFALAHRHTGLLGYFRFALTREDYERSKPDPEPYRVAAERHGWRPEECLVIEDSPRGLTAATRAGMRCIVVPTELTRGGDFARALCVLDSVRDVAAAVLPLLA